MTNGTRASCVIGWPAKHSRSPMLHGYWLRRYRIDGDYRAEEVPPDAFPAFLADLAGHGYIGANITLPHKEAALAMTEPDDRAQAVGAANTVWLDRGRLRSTNSDVEGFLGALDFSAPGWDQTVETAVVLGAGGAARAVVFGLVERGIQNIHVVNRTLDRAVAFRDRFGPGVHPARWEDLPRVLEGADLLANSTPLGMKGQPDIEIDLAAMADGALVADIVYVPLETRLLAAAERRGLRTANGLDMLLYQAVRGFELWYSVRPEVTAELRALLGADINK
jgi:shikimate dehydrogenase